MYMYQILHLLNQVTFTPFSSYTLIVQPAVQVFSSPVYITPLSYTFLLLSLVIMITWSDLNVYFPKPGPKSRYIYEKDLVGHSSGVYVLAANFSGTLLAS